MNKNMLTFGLIAGVISSIWIVIYPTLDQKTFDYDMGMVYGFTAMIVGFSMIFVGIKNYRDKFNNGVIPFGRAFLIGLYISLIASTVYVVTWLISYFFFLPDFYDIMVASYQKKLVAEGLSGPELKEKMDNMTSMRDLYNNPFFNAAITYTEILPVGLVISLIAAMILKRKTPTHQTQTA